MNKRLINWGLALLTAFIVIILLRLFFFQIYTFSGNSMQKTLFDNESVLISKYSKFRRGSIVLYTNPEDSAYSLKRLVAMPEDTLIIKKSNLFINNKYYLFRGETKLYRISEFGNKLSDEKAELYRFYNLINKETGTYGQSLTISDVKKIINDSLIYISPLIYPGDGNSPEIFPNSIKYNWTADNFGPLVIPSKGQKVNITEENIFLYKIIIEKYESNSVLIKKSGIYLNNSKIEEYTFKNDYCFVLNDNRSNYSDSRRFGFLPLKFIRGKALIITNSPRKGRILKKIK